jgi:hypothetical protein
MREIQMKMTVGDMDERVDSVRRLTRQFDSISRLQFASGCADCKRSRSVTAHYVIASLFHGRHLRRQRVAAPDEIGRFGCQINLMASITDHFTREMYEGCNQGPKAQKAFI